MKRSLPTSTALSVNKSKGFTLVELLIVITIIAILSVIGVTIYAGIQPGARNARRRADIDDIVKALETNKTPTGYVALATTQFSNGVIPVTDPQSLAYCGITAPANGLTAAPTANACTPNTYSQLSVTVPVPAAGSTTWQVCTWLEAANGLLAQSYCRRNTQ